jgi:hypothetical protein
MGKLKIVEELFKGRHFDRGIVILCVRSSDGRLKRWSVGVFMIVSQDGICLSPLQHAKRTLPFAHLTGVPLSSTLRRETSLFDPDSWRQQAVWTASD